MADLKDITIRIAQKEDAAHVLSHVLKIGDETHNLTFSSKDFGLSVLQEGEFLSKTSSVGSYLIAEDKGSVIGSVNLGIPTRERVKRTAELSISVQKAYWGTGVADLLMHAIIQQARNLDIHKINLTVRSDNKRAIRFYERHQFVREGETSRMFYIDGCWISGTFYGLELS